MSVTTSTVWERALPTRLYEEEKLQASAMRFLDLALPPNAIAHHSPGEGKRTLKARHQLKRSGYKKGWPDIEIIWRGRERSIFIELKVPGGYVRPEQRAMHNRLIYCGAEVFVARSVPEVEALLRGIGIPLRASVAA